MTAELGILVTATRFFRVCYLSRVFQHWFASRIHDSNATHFGTSIFSRTRDDRISSMLWFIAQTAVQTQASCFEAFEICRHSHVALQRAWTYASPRLCTATSLRRWERSEPASRRCSIQRGSDDLSLCQAKFRWFFFNV